MRIIVTDKKRDAFMNDVIRIATNAANRLMLTDWTIRLVFKKEELCEGVAAETNSNVVYKQGMIKVYPCAKEEWKDDPELLEEIITHEVCHLFLAKLQDLCGSRWGTAEDLNSAVESTTSVLARIIYPLDHKSAKVLDKKKKK
jgi:hypothetical protein